MSRQFAWIAVCFAAALTACGGSGDDGGNGGSGSQSSSFECCRNGEYYSCSSESAVNACFDSGDTSGCNHTKSDPNGECN
jgi:hypothetical protein